MRRSRRLAILMATALPGLSFGAVALVSACSGKQLPPPGAVMVSIDTNMKAPDDIDTIGLSAQLADGTSVFADDLLFAVQPNGTATFPATYAVVRGTDEPIAVTIVGYKNGVPITLRKSVTTIPSDRTALLRMEIDWLDKSTIANPTEKDIIKLDSTCGPALTSIAGSCQPFNFDSLSQSVDGGGLPTLTAADNVSSTTPSECFNVDTCYDGFAAAATPANITYVVPDSACTVDAPAGSLDNVNYGLRLKGGADGWCNKDNSGCIIPLSRDENTGWRVTANGRIQLPPGACSNMKVKSYVQVTSPCATKSRAQPACQSYLDDAAAPPSDDATVPVDAFVPPIPDAAPDSTVAQMDAAPSPDSGPNLGPPDIALNVNAVYAVAADATHVFVLDQLLAGSGGSITSVDSSFLDTPTTRSVSINVTSGTSELALLYPKLAVGGSDAFQVVNVTDYSDAGHFAASGTDLTLMQDGTGVRALVASCLNANASPGLCWGDSDGGLAYAGTGTRVASVGLDPTTDAAAPLFAYFTPFVAGTTGPSTQATVHYGYFADDAVGLHQNNVVVSPVSQAVTGFVVPDAEHLAWIDSNHEICISEKVAGDTYFCDGKASALGSLSTGNGAIFWIDTGGAVQRYVLTAGVPSGTGFTVTQIASISGATAMTISGTEMYWTSGTSPATTRLHRVDIRTLP